MNSYAHSKDKKNKAKWDARRKNWRFLGKVISVVKNQRGSSNSEMLGIKWNFMEICTNSNWVISEVSNWFLKIHDSYNGKKQ